MAAKFVGRWRNTGAPLVNVPDEASNERWEKEFETTSKEQQAAMLSNFTYDDDMSDARCPMSGHMRRVNPRASLELKAGACPGKWVNYGNDFREANDKDFILGNRSNNLPNRVIHQADPEGEAPPRFVRNIPLWVETRGGDYFFVPSLTALRLIALCFK